MGRKKKEPEKKPHPYSVAATGGRPPFFKTPQQMEKKIDEYFEYIKGKKVTEMRMVVQADQSEELQSVTYWEWEPERPTITGLCLYLGFSTREGFNRYKEKDERFVSVIARGKMRVEKAYEQATQDRNSARGAIFVLGNMGWSNRTEIQQLGKDGRPVDPPSPTVITNVMPNIDKEI